jgi:hypothetical protein
MKLRLIPLALVGLTGACNYAVRDIATVPDNPTYNRDIFPLYADHCLLCHMSPPNRGAPDTFRLDSYGDSDSATGAGSMAFMCLDQVKRKLMPPAAKSGDGVGPKGLEMLQKWYDNGAPEK